jgi:flagellin
MGALTILTNIASIAAENQLNTTNLNLNNTLEQLSSGSRINSGADDPAGLAIANGLEANVTALTQSQQNVNDGVGMLQVADGALSQVTSLLNRAVTLATESSTDTVSDSQRVALQAEFSQITAEIDQIGSNTTYNGSAIFSGGDANYNQVAAANTAASDATAVTGTLTIGTTGGSAIYTTSANDKTVGDLINDINGSGTGLVATLDANGHLMITDTYNRGSAAANELQGTGSDTFAIGADSSETFTNTTDSSTMNVFLSDSTQVGSSQIGVTLGQLSSSNMNGVSLASDNLSTAGAAQTALTDINNAINQVSALRGQLGASTERLQSASQVISTQSQNLTSAENGITAADIPTTVANLSKYSILEQTGISALSQANQQQQLVLKLLQ